MPGKIALSLFIVSASVLLGGCTMQEAAAAPEKSPKSGTRLATGPVVVELYQSQGCSSCPPANAALNAMADRSDVIALSFAVTYWDQLGWKDIFADPAYTQRQYAYAKSLGQSGVYTPQVVLNGRRAIVGNGAGELDRAVAATRAATGGPSIDHDGGSIAIGSGSGSGGGGGDVLLVRYDPRTHQVAIQSGENGGRKLPHRNIVRQLVRLGGWNGARVVYKMPASPDARWKSVILVQAKQTGPILAAKAI